MNKMRLNRGELWFAINNPRIALSYLMRRQKIADLTGRPMQEVKSVLQEEELRKISEYVTHELGKFRELILGPSNRPTKAEVYYTSARLMRPRTIVETGVQAGISSAFLLQALEKNKSGMLYSIDLPDEDILTMIPSRDRCGMSSGWLVPKSLRNRWKLMLGKSQDKLEPLLDELGEVDLFLHDSDHTYENMIYEFEVAWNHLNPNGLLLSDDVWFNHAFNDFAKKIGAQPVRILHYVAGLRKPDLPI